MFKEFLLLALTAGCFTQLVAVDTRNVDVDILYKQKRIFELFLFVDQTKLLDAEFYEVGRKYDIESNINLYTDQTIVREFLYRFRLGLLRRDALFSVFCQDHLDELRLVIKLLHTAKDFTTFYNTACWCRLYLNKGLFVTALMTVCTYRHDCREIIIPPVYEIYPHLFFDNTVIQEAYRIKMVSGGVRTSDIKDVYSHIIDTNLTTLLNIDTTIIDKRLHYFTDDVDLNNYYYYLRTIFPLWVSLKNVDVLKDIRGEFYYYIHQQLLARYNLERLSVGLGDIEDIDVERKIIPDYVSTLVHGNGVIVPGRTAMTDLPIYKYKYIREIRNLELRILDAIDSGLILDKTGKFINIYTTDGLNILGNLIEGNLDSCNLRYYGAIEKLYRKLLGVNIDVSDKNLVVPSVLETYTATLRDPVFYRIVKLITKFFIRYKGNLPVYTAKDLGFTGVVIDDIKVDKLVTYFDKCDYSIRNVLGVETLKEGLKWDIKARKVCLKTKPFTYNILVKSDRMVKGVVRIFLGPNVDVCRVDDRLCLNRRWYDFVELDKFTVDLNVGVNTIRRLNTDCMHCLKNLWTTDVIYKRLVDALRGNSVLTIADKIVGLPSHLYLPRGRVGGLKFKLFVTITPLDVNSQTIVSVPLLGKVLLDGKTFGFPLDRPLMPWLLDLKNIVLRDVVIHNVENVVDVDTIINRDIDYNIEDRRGKLVRDDIWMRQGVRKDIIL